MKLIRNNVARCAYCNKIHIKYLCVSCVHVCMHFLKWSDSHNHFEIFPSLCIVAVYKEYRISRDREREEKEEEEEEGGGMEWKRQRKVTTAPPPFFSFSFSSSLGH